MHHNKFNKIKTVVAADMAVLLSGPAGSGKSTLALNVAEELGLKLYTMSMTRQTTVNNIIGFISINGKYIKTQFRDAFENGGVMLLDEIDAADPNTLLCLNTIENGYMAFPDCIINKHKDFRLIATCNPVDEHSAYTGRSKLDLATMDRFLVEDIPLDTKLEEHIVGKAKLEVITKARKMLTVNGITNGVSMRDGIRYSKLVDVGVGDELVALFKSNIDLMDEFKSTYKVPAITVESLWQELVKESK